MKDWFKTHGKVIALFIGGIVLVWQQVRTGGITVEEWVLLAQATVAGFLTYWVPNFTGGLQKYSKAIAMAVAGVLAALLMALPGGITGDEAQDLVILFFTLLGVITFPSQQVVPGEVVTTGPVAKRAA